MNIPPSLPAAHRPAHLLHRVSIRPDIDSPSAPPRPAPPRPLRSRAAGCGAHGDAGVGAGVGAQPRLEERLVHHHLPHAVLKHVVRITGVSAGLPGTTTTAERGARTAASAAGSHAHIRAGRRRTGRPQPMRTSSPALSTARCSAARRRGASRPSEGGAQLTLHGGRRVCVCVRWGAGGVGGRGSRHHCRRCLACRRSPSRRTPRVCQRQPRRSQRAHSTPCQSKAAWRAALVRGGRWCSSLGRCWRAGSGPGLRLGAAPRVFRARPGSICQPEVRLHAATCEWWVATRRCGSCGAALMAAEVVAQRDRDAPPGVAKPATPTVPRAEASSRRRRRPRRPLRRALGLALAPDPPHAPVVVLRRLRMPKAARRRLCSAHLRMTSWRRPGALRCAGLPKNGLAFH